MSFTITIREVADKDLGSVLAPLHLKGRAEMTLVHSDDEPQEPVVKKKRKVKVKKNDLLTMTGKRPKDPKTLIGQMLVTFEKLEATHGIGAISVGAFREALGKKRNMQYRLVREGYLEILR